MTTGCPEQLPPHSKNPGGRAPERPLGPVGAHELFHENVRGSKTSFCIRQNDLEWVGSSPIRIQSESKPLNRL
jgi:hypothetical protein